MRRWRGGNGGRFVILATLLMGTVAYGQEEEPLAPPVGTAPEIPARWEYFAPLSPAAKEKAAADDGEQGQKLAAVILGPEVFSHARLDLFDLRLRDAAGKNVPYALRYLRPQAVRDRVDTVEFNRDEPQDGPVEVTLDLKRDDIQHNEVEVTMSGDNYRRQVEVEGSDDNRTWRRLAATPLLQFAAAGQKIHLRAVSYPDSRHRYVRVRVFPDPSLKEDRFSVSAANVLRHVDLPGELVTLDGRLGERAPTRTYRGPGSAWIIDLGGDHVPCGKLIVDIADAEFNRDFQIEFALKDSPGGRNPFSPVLLTSNAVWQRRPGEARKPLVAEFNEVQASRLRLVVTDSRNPPLTIRSVKFAAAARQVVFSRAAGDAPKLYFGNSEVEPPNYDFARNLPVKLPEPPARWQLGQIERNPDFVPSPKAFTERFPWLIYVVLGSVSLVLLFVIVSLSRRAIAIHDEAVQV